MFAGAPAEERLSQLCFWVLEFDRSNQEYGLRLPGVVIHPASGESHRTQVLRHLALWGLTG
jgi:uncharacterized protein (DUF58 family)